MLNKEIKDTILHLLDKYGPMNRQQIYARLVLLDEFKISETLVITYLDSLENKDNLIDCSEYGFLRIRK